MKCLSFEEMNRIRHKSEQELNEIRRKISVEEAINISKWNKEDSWAKLLR